MTFCVASADSASLAWWLLPERQAGIPHELEEDENGLWQELWQRVDLEEKSSPPIVMEQALGAKWAGFYPNRDGKPELIYFVLNQHKIFEIQKDKTRTGLINNSEIQWSDQTKSLLFEQKKRKRGRRARSRGVKINFGKVAVPTPKLPAVKKDNWVVEDLSAFLELLPKLPEKQITPKNLTSIAQMSDGSLLHFKYDSSCSTNDRKKIEKALTKIEPKLTCWASQKEARSLKTLAVLLQNPVIECKISKTKDDVCAKASLPLKEAFFATTPKIILNINKCEDDLKDTLLHETFHLTGIAEKSEEFEKSFEEAEACDSYKEEISFESTSEEFTNDLQVQTRMSIFNKIREAKPEELNLSAGEKSYALGLLCKQMNDKYCARRYFQEAVEAKLQGSVELPEGEPVNFSTLAHYMLFDSISEDIYRMREFARYLGKDPQGKLMRRFESESHRAHEFYVAKSSLETIKNNKGICNSEIDERVLCEDLAQIIKTPWFKGY